LISALLAIVRGITVISALCTCILFVLGMRFYAVQTGSMSPTLSVGSLCVVDHHTDFNTIQNGDIIVFKISDSTVVTHRVVKITENGLVTKGDANNAEDAGYVTQDNFVGKNIFVIPKLGFVILLIRNPRGIISVVFITIGIIMLSMFIEHLKDLHHKEH